MYCHGNPVLYEDPTGHAATPSPATPNVSPQANPSGGGNAKPIGPSRKPRHVPGKDDVESPWKAAGRELDAALSKRTGMNGGRPVNAAGRNGGGGNLISDLEKKVGNSLGHPVSFRQGLHIVMIENNIAADGNIDRYQRQWGSYLQPLGNDTFRAKYFIINNGDILSGSGTSKSSLHSSNAGNDLRPGEYYIHGELKNNNDSPSYMRLFNNKDQADAYYRGGPGMGLKNENAGSGATSVPWSQSSLQLHSPFTEYTDFSQYGGSPWSGGKGCQLLRGFSEFNGRYSKSEWRNLEGKYYLINQ